MTTPTLVFEVKVMPTGELVIEVSPKKNRFLKEVEMPPSRMPYSRKKQAISCLGGNNEQF
jgi:hypothetical protein